MSRALAAAAGLVALLATMAESPEAAASPRKKIADVCEGCLATVPEDDDAPVPLLVTLHGDWGYMAPDLHRAWERFAAPRGVALLSLACPTKLGCKGSFWQWNGEPSWIVAQVDRLATSRALDRDRLWIAGWSGGASYIGMRTQEIERTFAGIVIHGGGVWPSPDDCPKEKARVVFLVGDRNPLHRNGLELRDHYARCGNELTFHLLRGAEHEAEWRALGEKGGTILDALATARMTRRASAPAAEAAPPPPAVVSATSSAGPAEVAPPQPSPSSASRVRPRAGCGCRVAAREGSRVDVAGAMLVVALLAARRRKATRGLRASSWHSVAHGAPRRCRRMAGIQASAPGNGRCVAAGHDTRSPRSRSRRHPRCDLRLRRLWWHRG